MKSGGIRHISIIAIAFSILIAPPAAGSDPDPALAAYRQMEAWHADPDLLIAARHQTRRAAELGAERWQLLLNRSLGALVAGYKSGDPYAMESYMRGSLDRATALAREALEEGPNSELVHSHVGLLHLIEDDRSKAHASFARARALDEAAFRPWLYGAALEVRDGDLQRARWSLGEAEARSKRAEQLVRVDRLRVAIARRSGDVEWERRLHDQLVVANPASARDLVAYGDFLSRRLELEEALELYQRAVAIQRSPAAVAGLEKVELRLELRGRERPQDALPIASTP